ncbi:MAG: topoisomerase DNA-binding C4 zinc finger domain-containing protein [Acidobacteriia bacterium]|nr:topoisomerase DNA-binding C4 zinc finger domain-containing protein [Terriglobia bacterium]
MSEFLPEYLNWGLSDIVVVGRDEREESSGFQNEYTTEWVVARKGDGFVRVELHEKKDFSPRGGRKVRKVSEQQISEAEYKSAASGKPAIDTDAEVRKVEQAEHKQQRMEELLEQVNKLAPECPDHGSTMKAKSGKYGPFWGCKRFPKCSYTAGMSPDAMALYQRWYKGEA